MYRITRESRPTKNLILRRIKPCIKVDRITKGSLKWDKLLFGFQEYRIVSLDVRK